MEIDDRLFKDKNGNANFDREEIHFILLKMKLIVFMYNGIEKFLERRR